MSLAGKTIFISGGSRGIGLAIALRAARDGANIIVAAKTTEAHPKLPGTIFTAQREIEAAGGKCLPLKVDIRFEEEVNQAVNQAAEHFGGIDILVNNASAIQLTPILQTDAKKWDLMSGINARGTFLCGKACHPFLKKAKNPQILTLSPPLNLNPKWFRGYTPYTISKYGMSMCTLGFAQEFKKDGIAANSLWPATAIATAALQMVPGIVVDRDCRKADIMADAAHAILLKDAKTFSGNFLVDEEVLRAEGIVNFDIYKIQPNSDPKADFFLG